jgi:hypothetical protein
VLSLAFVVHDLAIFLILLSGTLYLKEKVNSHTRFLICYIIYPYLAGLPLTGLWVLAHECGHGAFSTSSVVTHSVGWTIHSALMSPYFAWRSSHGRHHQFANNIAIDLNYVPPQKDEYSELFRGKVDLDHFVQDAPVVVLLRIVFQQIIGWPWVSNFSSYIPPLLSVLLSCLVPSFSCLCCIGRTQSFQIKYQNSYTLPIYLCQIHADYDCRSTFSPISQPGRKARRRSPGAGGTILIFCLQARSFVPMSFGI